MTDGLRPTTAAARSCLTGAPTPCICRFRKFYGTWHLWAFIDMHRLPVVQPECNVRDPVDFRADGRRERPNGKTGRLIEGRAMDMACNPENLSAGDHQRSSWWEWGLGRWHENQSPCQNQQRVVGEVERCLIPGSITRDNQGNQDSTNWWITCCLFRSPRRWFICFSIIDEE